ncbi:DnaA/Hda family protein [Chlamydiales bacterium]|nr:DnaA/Hda family protein [Chlamydiales bacterium]
MHAWDSFLKDVERDLGESTVEKWIRPLKVLRFDAENLYLQAKDTFQVLWFEEHLRQKILKNFINNNHRHIRVHLSTVQSGGTLTPQKRWLKKNIQSIQEPVKFTFDSLDPTTQLESFLFHKKNQLAQRLIYEQLNYSPETFSFSPNSSVLPEFNPIYFYGPSGSGKTHLLMGYTHILRNHGIKAIYSRASTFTEHLVMAIRSANMNSFRELWRSCDVLLIDDIQTFSKKAATQEEFFHTFNTLHLSGKQIIVSSDISPSELIHIEPRLVSRFEWGIVIPLVPLTKEYYSTLLNKRAESLGFQIPQKIILYLMDLFQSSPKGLMKAFDALVLRTHLEKGMNHSFNQFTLQGIKKLLGDLIKEEEHSLITPIKIIKAVAEQYGIKSDDILGKGQTRDCIVPRQLAMHLCRDILKLSYAKIGDIFLRDHSTVMNAIKQVSKGMEKSDSELPSAIQQITKKLKYN